MAAIPPPSHLSAEAQAYLADPPPPPDAPDLTDIAATQEFRIAAHAEWVLLNNELSGTWVTRDETIAGVSVVRFAETEAQLDSTDVIVHLHGGAYFLGSPQTNASLVVPITQRTGLPVISVDYRLAPEHKCPAAINDSVAVVGALNADHHVVAMYGESAGGGLALAAAVALRDAGATLPDRLGLLSPWVDLTISGDTYQTLQHIDPDFPDPTDPPAFAAAYAGDDTANPQASPLFADLVGLPPTLTQVGSREILLSDSCRLDAALRSAGVESTLDIWDGLWHVWQMWPHIPESQTAFDELAAFLTGNSAN